MLILISYKLVELPELRRQDKKNRQNSIDDLDEFTDSETANADANFV